ncbi:MAG: T9SS type A sorting domain-containing protein [Fimbriimonadaceae bacterium]|nr:T9SS type A sorting domain-containing protein [Chitinophagales bacterium]
MFQRNFILFFIITFSFSKVFAQSRATSSISDSIDITHFIIQLNVTDYAGKTIHGNTEINFKAKVDAITQIPLDLLALNVDSVIAENGTHLLFTHIGEKLLIDLASILNTNDSTNIKIYYGGEPEADASWGGWYWSGDYSYQLGVAFDALPHNFGRVWFPCFDNFVERSTFRFEITTPSDKKAFCGGLLESETDNGDDTKTWIWNLNQSIPSYLASVAVSKYATVNMNYAGIERDIPIQIGVKAEDSTDLKNSFINLQNAMSTFENHYGAYEWDRVGYAVVPFSGGAMEHAMNIAYPLFAINGTTAYESLMSHELSHQWWGDLITCSTPQEMWLNEGWASYSEHLFNEQVYGTTAYSNGIKNNHTFVLHYAAANDGNNYFALSAMPEDYTYSTTTYKKGADIIYTLRSYMGDEHFFNCITSFLETYKFQSVNAAQLRDHLSDCSGIDLTSFFNNWIYAPGFPSFEIEDYGFTDYGTIKSICVEQKLKHAPAFYNNVPLTISFFDTNWNIYYEETIIMSGEHATFTLPDITIPFAAIIDYHEKISDAVTSDETVLRTITDYYLPNTFVTLSPTILSDSAIIYSQQYWVEADNFKTVNHGLHVNSQRYWKFTGLLPDDFHAEATIRYNGKLGISDGNQDNEFISTIEDSLVLLYRTDQNDEWEVYPYYSLNDLGPNNDKFGQFELDTFLLGEYAIGMYNAGIADAPADEMFNCIDELTVENISENTFSLFPNPAQEIVTVQFNGANIFDTIQLIDISGKLISTYLLTGENTFTFSTKDVTTGTYEIKCTSVDNRVIATQKLIIIR